MRRISTYNHSAKTPALVWLCTKTRIMPLDIVVLRITTSISCIDEALLVQSPLVCKRAQGYLPLGGFAPKLQATTR
jgi:hypothetical protein